MLSNKTIRACLIIRMTNKSSMDFKTGECSSLFHCKHSELNECSSAELVSIVFSSLFFHGSEHRLQKGCT